MAKELRELEWNGLEAVYPGILPHPDPPKDDVQFTLATRVEFERPFNPQGQSTGRKKGTLIYISHLPPFRISLCLPSTYPLEDPPYIKAIETDCGWFPVGLIDKLTKILLAMWEGECVLGVWMAHLRTGEELCASLEISPSDLIRHWHGSSSSAPLIDALSSYNASAHKADFNEKKFVCPVCFVRVFGRECVALFPCGHVVCRKCLKTAWDVHIGEGYIERVVCLDPACLKLARSVSVENVENVVSSEYAEKWKWLMRRKAMGHDPSVVSCLNSLHPKREPGKDLKVMAGYVEICWCGLSIPVEEYNQMMAKKKAANGTQNS